MTARNHTRNYTSLTDAALAGTALIVGRNGLAFDPAYSLGYITAFLCAFTWAAYSLVSRKFAKVPTDVVSGFCLATSVLSIVAHLLIETTMWPETTEQWAAVVWLGLFPVGLAFYAWDYGVKRGDIQILGASSYAAPLLSTAILVLFGFGEFSIWTGLSCLLITGGAMLAAREMLERNGAKNHRLQA